LHLRKVSAIVLITIWKEELRWRL